MFNYFITSTGRKIPAVTSEQMILIDKIAFEETGPDYPQMMENAGRDLAVAALEMTGDLWKEIKIGIFAGKGGNGGGGICCARHLANRGIFVDLILIEKENMIDINYGQLNSFRNTGLTEKTLADVQHEKYDLIVDALIGYNLKGVPDPKYSEAINFINSNAVRILSNDVPSGLDATTGVTPGVVVKAAKTLTLGIPKTGLNPIYCGDIILGDLGIPLLTYKKAGIELSEPLFENNYYFEISPI